MDDKTQNSGEGQAQETTVAKKSFKDFFSKQRLTSIGKVGGIVVAVLAIITILALSIYSVAAYAPLRVNVDLGEGKQTVKGFGASSAWVYQELGKPEYEASANKAIDLLYGDDGLQLNIFRFNIGGGSAESRFDDMVPYNNSWFDPLRRAESFFIADRYTGDKAVFKDLANYDFEGRDVEVQNMFTKALNTGNVDKVVFFANSPHYLMTESGKCTGEVEYQNNLKPEFYEAFSDYMLACVKGLYDKHLAGLENVPEVWISPVNEPQWKWGGPDASQEGCHFDPDVLAKFYDVFYDTLQEFNSANGTNFKMDVFESGNYKFRPFDVDIADYLEEMSKYDYFDQLEEISVHTYGANESKSVREKFAKFMDKNYPQLKVSPSEFCEMQGGEFDTIESGIFLAQVVLRDLTMIDAVEWTWWLSVAMGGYNDGLVYWNPSRTEHADNDNIWLLKRYYTFAQITRFLDNGDVRVEGKISDLTGWAGVDVGVFKKPDGRVVVIAINDGKAKSLKLNGLQQFMDESVAVTTTTADSNLSESTITFDGKVNLAEKSVTTFVFG